MGKFLHRTLPNTFKHNIYITLMFYFVFTEYRPSGNGDRLGSNADEMEKDDREDMEVQLRVSILMFFSVR